MKTFSTCSLIFVVAMLTMGMACGGGGSNSGTTPPPTPTAAAPTFTPVAGTYTTSQSVSLSTTTAGASIYYTTDGSTPTTSSTRFTAPISVASSMTIKALAAVSGYKNSEVSSATYTIQQAQAAAPTFTPAGGTYTSTQTVTIATATQGADIYYSIDDSTISTSYTGPINVASNHTLKAFARKSGLVDSTVASAAYSFNLPSPSYSWNNVQIVAGGFITGILFHPTQPNLAYTRTDIGGTYRWDNTAQRWIPLTDWIGFANSNYLGTEAIGLDPSDPQRLYLAGGTYIQSWAGNGAMLVSSDQGKTFTTVPMPFKMGGNEDGRFAGERFGVDPNSGNIVYFGSRLNGLWKSTDYGLHWTQVTNFPAFTGTTSKAGIVFVDLVKASGTQGSATPVIYVGVSDTATHLYRSTDAGATWTAVPGQPTGMYVNHGVFGPDGNLFLTYANNIGPNGATSGAIYKYTPDASNAGGNGTWANISPGTSGFANIAVDARSPGTIIASTLDYWWPGDTLYRSTNGGTSWTSLKNTNPVYDYSVSPWLTSIQPSGNLGWWMGALAIDPFNSDHVMYGTGAAIWETKDVTKMDANSASHWTVGAYGIEETAVLGLISPWQGPANLISALGDINGFVHTDFTRSPSAMQGPLFSTTTGIDFAQKNPAVMARVGNNGNKAPLGAYSTDAGVTWTAFASHPMTVDGGTIAVAADGSRFVWSAGDGKVYYTTNKGSSWTASTGAPSGKPVFSDRLSSSKFYILDAGGRTLYVSTDGGATFTPANSNLPGDWNDVLSASYAGHLWLSTRGGLYCSADSGVTWTNVGSVQEAYAVSFGKAIDDLSYPTLYLAGKVAGTQAIFRSVDKGATWTRVNDDQHQYGWIGVISGDPRVFGRVYIGANGRGVVYGEQKN